MSRSSDFITMTCPSCGAQTRIDAFAEKLTCEYCGNQHILRSESRPALRPEVPQPANVLVENDRGTARLIQRWFSLKFIPLAFFAFVWDAFLIFWYGTAVNAGMPWIMIVFPIAHVAVGVGITYYTVAGFINRTVLEVTRDEVSVWFEPLPWPGEKKFRTSEIKQFFCKDKFVRSKNGGTMQYELYVVNQANQQVKLLGGLDNPDVALFFEQQLERWLRITDRPVAGEMER